MNCFHSMAFPPTVCENQVISAKSGKNVWDRVIAQCVIVWTKIMRPVGEHANSIKFLNKLQVQKDKYRKTE